MCVRPEDGKPSEWICRTDLRIVNDLDRNDGIRSSEDRALPGIHAENATGFVGMGRNTDTAMVMNDRSHMGYGLIRGLVTVPASSLVLAKNQHSVELSDSLEGSKIPRMWVPPLAVLNAREDDELRKLRVLSTQLF